VSALTINCVQAYYEETNLAHNFQWSTMGVNVLYNAGFMFTDILNIVFYNYANTNPYWYYVAYNMGDFFVRFFF